MMEIILSGIENPIIRIPNDTIEFQKELCLEAEKITKVSNAEEQEAAVRVAGKLKKFLNDIEAQRKELKKPVIDLGKLLDDKIKNFISTAEDTLFHLGGKISVFQDAERVRAQRIREEEERVRREAMKKAAEEEAEINRKMLLAKNEMEQEALEIEMEKKKDEFREKIIESHAAVVVAAPPKSKGMAVSKEYDFEVLDVHEVYKMNPAFVKLEVNRVVIKSMLKQGMKQCPGLKIFEVETKINFRAAK